MEHTLSQIVGALFLCPISILICDFYSTCSDCLLIFLMDVWRLDTQAFPTSPSPAGILHILSTPASIQCLRISQGYHILQYPTPAYIIPVKSLTS